MIRHLPEFNFNDEERHIYFTIKSFFACLVKCRHYWIYKCLHALTPDIIYNVKKINHVFSLKSGILVVNYVSC